MWNLKKPQINPPPKKTKTKQTKQENRLVFTIRDGGWGLVGMGDGGQVHGDGW